MGHNALDVAPHSRTCDSCLADIFNRRFHCFECGTDMEDGYDLCVQCLCDQYYCEVHPHKLHLVERFSLQELSSLYSQASKLVVDTKKQHEVQMLNHEGEHRWPTKPNCNI